MHGSLLFSRFRQKSPELKERMRPSVRKNYVFCRYLITGTKTPFLLRICKYALDERIEGIFCNHHKPAYFCHPEVSRYFMKNTWSRPTWGWSSLLCKATRILNSVSVWNLFSLISCSTCWSSAGFTKYRAWWLLPSLRWRDGGNNWRQEERLRIPATCAPAPWPAVLFQIEYLNIWY